MPGNTIPQNYPYPLYTDPQNFPADLQALATAVDTDVQALYDASDLAFDEPSVRVFRNTVQAIAQNVNVTVAYGAVETYDNDNMFNFGVSTTNITVNTPGVYLVSGSTTMAPSGAGGGAVALVTASSGALLTNPFGVSRALDDDKETSLSYTTLHYVPTAPETLTQFIRHNHGAGLSSTFAQFTVTRIA